MKAITRPVLNDVIINNMEELELAKSFMDVPTIENIVFPIVLEVWGEEIIGYDISAPTDLLSYSYKPAKIKSVKQ